MTDKTFTCNFDTQTIEINLNVEKPYETLGGIKELVKPHPIGTIILNGDLRNDDACNVVGMMKEPKTCIVRNCEVSDDMDRIKYLTTIAKDKFPHWGDATFVFSTPEKKVKGITKLGGHRIGDFFAYDTIDATEKDYDFSMGSMYKKYVQLPAEEYEW